jgi:hypothetical protein
MTRIIALTALTTLELSGLPFHEPVHGQGTVQGVAGTFVMTAP